MKFRPSAIILIVMVILTMTEYSLAQTTDITEQDYRVGIRAGYVATEKQFPRRETETYENLPDGQVTYSETVVTEYLSKDTYRTAETVVRQGKTFLTESIQIASARYCRENGGEWKSCYEPPPRPLYSADGNKYAIEKNKDSITLIRIATSLKKEGDNVAPAKLTEDRMVLNSDMSIRERSMVTTINEKKTIVQRRTRKVEYGITLKPISAPIK